jgi:hypothetical protein
MSEARKSLTTASPLRKRNEGRAKISNAAQSLRFTPLRSSMTPAQILARESRGELGLSPLVPVARSRSYT